MRRSPVSKYRLMWMMVLFDLPVITKEERKVATDFRNFLLDQGFEMTQYSVYLRFCGNREKGETYVRLIRMSSPRTGKVSILFFTDKQFGGIVNIEGRKDKKIAEKPGQLELF